MAADPKECRETAKRCLKLAADTDDPVLKKSRSSNAPHQGLSMTHRLAASSSPAGKCLISAATKCDAKFSATVPKAESDTMPTFLMCL